MEEMGIRASAGAQTASAGDSMPEIHAAAFGLSDPRSGLAWLDIGCGHGDVLRRALECEPASLTGVDILDWLDRDLRAHVDMHVGPAESVLGEVPAADRVLMVETIEHLESPWTVLRAAAQAVRPGGRLVVSTPNIATLRHRLELLVRGQLTSFRPQHPPHLTPALPHVIRRIMEEEGLTVAESQYAAADVIPRTQGRAWPPALTRRAPRLLCISELHVGVRSS